MFKPIDVYDPEENLLKEILEPEEWSIIEKWKNPQKLAKEIIQAALRKAKAKSKNISGEMKNANRNLF